MSTSLSADRASTTLCAAGELLTDFTELVGGEISENSIDSFRWNNRTFADVGCSGFFLGADVIVADALGVTEVDGSAFTFSIPVRAAKRLFR